MRLLNLIIVTLLFSGCSYFEEKEDETLKWDAERLYSEAKDSLESGYWSEAVSHYEKLESRYPFGVYGQQSVLDLAYAYYKDDQPDQAISACNRFIKLFPLNAHVDYAYYLRALVNFDRGKGLTQRFLPIDTSQRDQASVQRAFDDFFELTKTFPDSQYVPDAQQRMVYLRNVLAEHEVNVASYYMRRGAYLAAANRARHVVEQYERTPAVPQALAVMAKSYKVMEMDDLSRDAIRVLRLNYPNYHGIVDVEEIEFKN